MDRSLLGYSPWGRQRFGHDLATKQQQRADEAKGDKDGSGVPLPSPNSKYIGIKHQGENERTDTALSLC